MARPWRCLLTLSTLVSSARSAGISTSPPFTGTSGIPNKPQPVVVDGQTYQPEPLSVQPGLTPLYYYDLPTTPADNPTPTFRPDQRFAALQQEQITGISRDTIPFTTILVPNPLLTELPNNTQYPLIYNYGRRLLDDADELDEPDQQLQLQHSRSLKQAYTYDSRGRLQYTPQNGAISSFDFQLAFGTAITNLSATGLVLTPPGSYQVVANLNGNPAHLALLCQNRQKAFELDLTGSTLTFLNVDYGGVYISGCANLNFHGPATLTYDTAALGFTQGTLTYVGQPNAAGQVIIVLRIDLGYPVNTLLFSGAALLAIPFDPVLGLLTTNTSDVYLPAPYYYAVDGAGLSYLYYNTYSQYGIVYGTRLAVRGLRGTHMISSSGNNYSTFANLRIETANEFAIASGAGVANRFLNNVIAPRATPFPGTVDVPLLSSVADGIHTSQELVGPTLNNNTILNNGDDAIAMEGTYYLVASTDPSRRQVVLTASFFKAAISVGDMLAAYSNTSKPLGTAKVTAVTTTTIPPAASAQGQSVTAAYSYTAASSTYLLVTLATFPTLFSSLVLDSLMSNQNRNCRGFTVTNNYVGLNRGRGMIIKASNGVITGNTVLLPKLPGIMMVPDLFFQEADFVTNITIQRNTITAERGGIQIGFYLSGTPTYPGAYPNHATLTISNNVLNGSSFTPLVITSAKSVTVRNNVFLNNFCYPYTYLDQTFPFVLQGSLISLTNIQSVSGSGNAISNPAKCGYMSATPYVASGIQSNVACC